MATYPTLNTGVDSTLQEIDGQIVEYMEDNSIRIRNYADSTRFRARLVHRISPTDAATLKTFYEVNRLVSFTYVWPGEGSGSPWNASYTMRFTAAPIIQRIRPGSAVDAYYKVDVMMEGTV